MIDYDTILSTTEDKMTLLQWLKKVEAALKDASATTFKVNKKGDATLTFSIVFADGSEIESGEIVLQQGESVASGAIVNGHLILTLTNGDVLDCGSLFNGNISINGDLQVTGDLDVDAITSSESEISAKKPIVELMVGYSFSKGGNVDANAVELTYCGVSKNANKLTFVIAGTFSPTAEITPSNNLNLGYFRVPQAIADLIVPMKGDAVDIKPAVFWHAYNVIISKNIYITKTQSTRIGFEILRLPDNIVNDNVYVFRVEATFLLSSNYAS